MGYPFTIDSKVILVIAPYSSTIMISLLYCEQKSLMLRSLFVVLDQL